MKLFIDSADIEEIEIALKGSIIDGVTTNPSLIKKAVEKYRGRSGKGKLDMQTYIEDILRLVGRSRPVSLEVAGTSYREMVREGKTLYKRFNRVARNVVVKIPVNPSLKLDSVSDFDGIKAIHALAQEGIPVNCTLVFTPEQALLAAKAGAKMVSPFAGRVDDYLRTKIGKKFGKGDYFPAHGIVKGKALVEDNGVISGVDLVAQIAQLFSLHNIQCEVLAASIRNPRQLREAALAGAHIATAPLAVLKQCTQHEKTVEGMKKFTKDIVPEYAKILKP
ncbi:transaldolase [Candidatus Pacearchaeota archaeon]|nr:MAG: transaldolase [Candidatus Pacearchaeota archaeon]